MPTSWFKILSIMMAMIPVFCSLGCGGGGGGGFKGEAPQARFKATPTVGSYPLTVFFDAAQSSDADGNITQYQWDFGDGDPGSGMSSQHTYESEGAFTAMLTVTDNDGMTGSFSAVIDVKRRFGAGGLIKSADHTTSDGDVNDPNADYASNDSFAEAQIIPAPVTVGGYVNVANAGPAGRSKALGDVDDFYQVFLAQGMNINLYMTADTEDSDLNLYLYDDTQALVDASLSTGEAVDTLSVPETGTYYIRIEAVHEGTMATATNYTLTIGQALSAGSQFPLRLSDDFVPGEMIVAFKQQDISTQSVSPSIMAQQLGFEVKAQGPASAMLLKLPGTPEDSGAVSILKQNETLRRRFDVGTIPASMRGKLETLWMVKLLRHREDVDFADPNFIRKPMVIPNDSFYDLQWHYPLINLPQAWDVTTGSNDVIVAVVDTGVLLDHPDLIGQLVSGYDFISDPDIAVDGDGLDANPYDPGDQDIGGSSFHGTHVTGTIAAATNNAIGGAGVAWQTRIMPLRALGKGGGTLYDIMNAVRYAAGFTNPSGTTPSRAADIINLSIGGSSPAQSESELYKEVRGAGLIIVAAAGNQGASASLYPASYPEVICVSAVTIQRELAEYSNSGDDITVAAPGGDLQYDVNGDGHGDGVLSTSGDDMGEGIEMAYAISQGTSMAAPHVSGVIALMKSVYSGLTPDLFDALLMNGDITQDIGLPGRDDSFGYGLIDANKAVQKAQELAGGGVAIPAILTVNPGSLNFGPYLESATLSIMSGGGTGPLEVTQVFEDADWLTVSPTADVDSSGLGTYLARVNRDGLSPGAYATTISFESTANTVYVSVVMQTLSSSNISHAGFHYILLVDPVTQSTIKQLNVGPDDEGNYPYLFTDLGYGEEYLIYAGSDPNNNNKICESGEACGAYISLDKPEVLTIIDDRTDLYFTTEFSVSLPAILADETTEKQASLKRMVLKEVVR